MYANTVGGQNVFCLTELENCVSGEHTNNSDDSSFVLPEEDGDGDEDSKAPKEREAVHNDSSDDDNSDGFMDRYHRDNAARRLQAAVQLKIFEDEMEEEGRRAELERRALLTDAEDPPNNATPTAASEGAKCLDFFKNVYSKH